MDKAYILAKYDIKEAIADWLNEKEGTKFKPSDVRLHHSDASMDGIYAQPEIYSAEVSKRE